MSQHPFQIIQGGMGIGVSGWPLANAVSRAGQLGVVSGTGIWVVVARRLQRGDPDGSARRALAHFPNPEIAAQVVARYYVPGGIPAGKPYKAIPKYTYTLHPELEKLMVAAAFAEVWLAREEHDGVVGVNLLEKIQNSIPPCLYGAMLAGVDYVLIGAGIPIQVPGVLDSLARHEPASYRIDVQGKRPADLFQYEFDPARILTPAQQPPLRRPYFFPIISSDTLASVMVKRSNGVVDGFVIEGSTAGGHNAPPRNRKNQTESGEAIYSEEDIPNLAKIAALGLPYWLAGSYASPAKIQEALALGAQGVQVGSIFALSRESSIASHLKVECIRRARAGTLEIRTDARCSPSGYPFKVADIPGTLAEEVIARSRSRICDLGALATFYLREDGTVGQRCPAEPVEDFLQKGGSLEETRGKACLCNALLATIDHAQRRKDDFAEPPLLTSGDDLSFLPRLLAGEETSYGAGDAVRYLLGQPAG